MLAQMLRLYRARMASNRAFKTNRWGITGDLLSMGGCQTKLSTSTDEGLLPRWLGGALSHVGTFAQIEEAHCIRAFTWRHFMHGRTPAPITDGPSGSSAL